MPKRRKKHIIKRSGFEDTFTLKLQKENVQFTYESDKIRYVEPEKTRTYTPDFFLTKKDGSIMIIETKGRWTVSDRQKMKLIKEQFPDLDIRMLFQRNNPIRKGSKTKYGDYCDKIGLRWAVDSLPSEWKQELK